MLYFNKHQKRIRVTHLYTAPYSLTYKLIEIVRETHRDCGTTTLTLLFYFNEIKYNINEKKMKKK